jgi:hypothetical protein
METKNKTHILHKVEDREHHYYCDPQCGLGEVFDALSKMLSFISQKISDSQKPVEKEVPQVQTEVTDGQ